jgi:Fe-S oxidoreductase
MENFKVNTMADLMAKGEKAEVLFWVGCAGSFDDRAKKVTKALAKILHHAGLKYAVLGTEESCTGDPAKRAGNEFLFQMQAMGNIATLNGYEVTRIVTACPHCFNTLKNEYPSMGGHYEVIHHSELLQELLDSGRIKVEGGAYKGRKVTYHDPCYLGRANEVYEAPRRVIMRLDSLMTEMKRSRANGLCCGAGGVQLFKEPEPGNKEIHMERTDEALELNPETIAVACPFCMTMISDGVKLHNKEAAVNVKDIAEMIAEAMDL